MAPPVKDAPFLLDIDEHGKAELIEVGEGTSLWSSDSDPEVFDYLNKEAGIETDYLEDEDAEDIVDYLVRAGILEADDEVDIESGPGDEDEEEEEDD